LHAELKRERAELHRDQPISIDNSFRSKSENPEPPSILISEGGGDNGSMKGSLLFPKDFARQFFESIPELHKFNPVQI